MARAIPEERYFWNGGRRYSATLCKADEREVSKALLRSGYDVAHYATVRGYCNVDRCYLAPYKGRFGDGYALFTHLLNCSQYSSIAYYVRKED